LLFALFHDLDGLAWRVKGGETTSPSSQTIGLSPR
jgi:hypothetical protein